MLQKETDILQDLGVDGKTERASRVCQPDIKTRRWILTF